MRLTLLGTVCSSVHVTAIGVLSVVIKQCSLGMLDVHTSDLRHITAMKSIRGWWLCHREQKKSLIGKPKRETFCHDGPNVRPARSRVSRFGKAAETLQSRTISSPMVHANNSVVTSSSDSDEECHKTTECRSLAGSLQDGTS